MEQLRESITELRTKKETWAEIQERILLWFGSEMVDVELEIGSPTMNHAVEMAFERFRLRSGMAQEESMLFLEVQPEQQEYYLPEEVMSIRKLVRRATSGSSSSGGSNADPFALSFTNQYLLGATGAAGVGGVGSSGNLTTYYLWGAFNKTLGRMTGAEIDYTWSKSTKKLTIDRKFLYSETIGIWAYNNRPDSIIWQDNDCRGWITRYATATAAISVANARGKFSSLPGPGGITLNAADLKTDAKEMFELCETEIQQYIASEPMGGGFIIG